MYAKIAKIRKQKLDKIESEVIRVKQEIKTLKRDLEAILNKIASLEIPKSGNMSVFATFNEQKRILGNEKDSILRKIQSKELELAKVYQEYEKSQYRV